MRDAGTADGFIRRAGTDGSNVEQLLGPIIVGGMAIDSEADKLYMTPLSDCAPGCTAIIRTDLDGSNLEQLFPAGFPGAIAVHPAFDLVCWSDGFLNGVGSSP